MMVRYLFSFLLFISFYSSHALEFIVKPYLQFATPTTITVLWETDQQCRSVVQYGEPKFHQPSANLEFSVKLQDTTLIHEVVLRNLKPEADYFYQVISINSAGDTFKE
jgi:phosphodiesterase/alkaline phosphatase D-like protein